ncbi:hypothetical protein ACOMHN_024061 [Nucella lapillus]
MDRRRKKQMSSPESLSMARQCSLMSSCQNMSPGSAAHRRRQASEADDTPPGSPRSPEVQHLWAHGNEPFRPRSRSRGAGSDRDGTPLMRKRLVLAKLTTHRSWPVSPSR